MTKVLLEFELSQQLTPRQLEHVAAAHSLYGMHRVTVSPGGDRLIVEYDASRLTPAQVEAALHRAGLPARLAP
jgi:hypothetical protein